MYLQEARWELEDDGGDLNRAEMLLPQAVALAWNLDGRALAAQAFAALSQVYCYRQPPDLRQGGLNRRKACEYGLAALMLWPHPSTTRDFRCIEAFLAALGKAEGYTAVDACRSILDVAKRPFTIVASMGDGGEERAQPVWDQAIRVVARSSGPCAPVSRNLA